VTRVIDTNVILVANRQHPDVSEACVDACVRLLYEVKENGRIAIDDSYQIIKEYLNKTQPQVGKRPGDAFLKWLLRNDANPARCDRVAIVAHAKRGFVSFPVDVRLDGFDPSDRKFVAVAAAHSERPAIAEAADSKWLGWAPALKDHGIMVEFLCPADVKFFDEKKKRGKKKRAR
jgi:hypothetical protein